MRRAIPAVLLALLGLTGLGADVPVIRVVDFQNVPITGATANRIVRGIAEAERSGDELVLVELDTPGGLVSAMEEIVKAMLASKVPIVVWVGPSGAQAASAGFLVLIAADVAAMAPGTRCGAASVIYGAGKSEEGDIGLKKATKDLAALLRSIADRRGRNIEACEKAVTAAEAYTEKEALEDGLIDIVAKDRDDLLRQLEGRKITRFDGETVVLRTEGARLVTTRNGFRQNVLEFLAHPAVVSILFLVGLAGLYVELSHPGLVFPGVLGALCLIVFLFAANQLPISNIGVLLILLGIVMFVLEIKVTSYGMLTLGGTVCLVIGSLMLVEGPIPELRVPPVVVVPSALVIAGLCAGVVRLAVRAQRARVATGVEGLAGEVGKVTKTLEPEGKVFVHGELWDATSTSGPLAAGTRVRVVRVRDMMLVVERVAPDDAEGG